MRDQWRWYCWSARYDDRVFDRPHIEAGDGSDGAEETEDEADHEAVEDGKSGLVQKWDSIFVPVKNV